MPEKNTLKVEEITEGLTFPTSMAFIDGNNLLVLEKDGQVRLISNGMLQKQPVLTVPVNTTTERGLLGIATISGGSSDDGRSSSGKQNHNIKGGNIIETSLGTVNKKQLQTLQIQKCFFTLLNPKLTSH
jgi:glucose/arabinose dehydrogenase